MDTTKFISFYEFSFGFWYKHRLWRYWESKSKNWPTSCKSLSWVVHMPLELPFLCIEYGPLIHSLTVIRYCCMYDLAVTDIIVLNDSPIRSTLFVILIRSLHYDCSRSHSQDSLAVMHQCKFLRFWLLCICYCQIWKFQVFHTFFICRQRSHPLGPVFVCFFLSILELNMWHLHFHTFVLSSHYEEGYGTVLWYSGLDTPHNVARGLQSFFFSK